VNLICNCYNYFHVFSKIACFLRSYNPITITFNFANFMSKESKRRKKPTKQTKKSLRFRYWDDWALIDREDGKCLFRIPKENENEIKKYRKQVFEQGKVEAIPELIRADPNSIKEPRVSMWVSRFSQMAPSDKKAKNIYEKIEKAMHGDLRGRTNPDELNKVINKDQEDFKVMVNQRFEDKLNVQDIIKNCQTKYIDPNKNLVWNNYIKIGRIILRGINGNEDSIAYWQNVFNYLEVMAKNFNQPSHIGHYQFGESWRRWVLVKGTGW